MNGVPENQSVPMEAINDTVVSPELVDLATQEDMFTNNEDIDRYLEERKKQMYETKDITQSQERFKNLGEYVMECWSAAREAKKEVNESLYRSALQRRGEYDAEKLEKIAQFSGSDIFMNITSVKCRATIAWIMDIISPSGEMSWSIRPTPSPDLKPIIDQEIEQVVQTSVTQNPYLIQSFDQMNELRNYIREQVDFAERQSAKASSERMTRKIKDQLEQSGWQRAVENFVSDMVTYKAGILKGPVPRRREVLTWEQSENGAWVPTQQDAVTISFERVSPFDFYPSPASTTIDDGFTIEHHRMTYRDLSELIGVPGYDETTIRYILEEYDNGFTGWLWDDTTRDNVENENRAGKITEQQSSPEQLIDALELWGGVPGYLLLEYGFTMDEIPDPEKDYQVNVWFIKDNVIKAIINPFPQKKKPYYKSSFEEIPGQFWGRGIPELIRDVQQTCNSAARNLINNMAISSGPQVVVDSLLLETGQDAEMMYPWKIWYYSNEDVINPSSGNPFQFFMPDSNAAELLKVFQYFSDKADEYTGIPSYLYGDSQVTGAGSTASGLAMLMSNASKTIKYSISSIDRNVIEPAITMLYIFNMMFDPDPTIKGDLQVVARGSLAVIEKEQIRLRRTEFLNAVVSNQYFVDIIGYDGIAKILREHAKDLSIDVEDVIPSEEELRAREMQRQELQKLQAQAAIIQQMPNANEQKPGAPAKKPAATNPDGSRAGGVDVNMFQNQPR